MQSQGAQQARMRNTSNGFLRTFWFTGVVALLLLAVTTAKPTARNSEHTSNNNPKDTESLQSYIAALSRNFEETSEPVPRELDVQRESDASPTTPKSVQSRSAIKFTTGMDMLPPSIMRQPESQGFNIGSLWDSLFGIQTPWLSAQNDEYVGCKVTCTKADGTEVIWYVPGGQQQPQPPKQPSVCYYKLVCEEPDDPYQIIYSNSPWYWDSSMMMNSGMAPWLRTAGMRPKIAKGLGMRPQTQEMPIVLGSQLAQDMYLNKPQKMYKGKVQSSGDSFNALKTLFRLYNCIARSAVKGRNKDSGCCSGGISGTTKCVKYKFIGPVSTCSSKNNNDDDKITYDNISGPADKPSNLKSESAVESLDNENLTKQSYNDSLPEETKYCQKVSSEGLMSKLRILSQRINDVAERLA